MEEGHIRNIFQSYCDNKNDSCNDKNDCIACALLWCKDQNQQELDRLKAENERLKLFVEEIADCTDPEMGEVLFEYKKEALKIINAKKAVEE